MSVFPEFVFQSNSRLLKHAVGVEDGMTIRVPGQGDAPISGKGPKGDLHVRVNVAASKNFRRQGVNIHHETRIPLHTALLGGKVRVPTLDGDVDVRVPGGTQQGEEMVLKGRGLTPVFGGDKGDLYISFFVQMPRYVYHHLRFLLTPFFVGRTLTKHQREILQQYADDVEGRTTKTEKTSETSDSEKTSSGSDSNQESRSGTNGTVSFSSPFSSTSSLEGGWISRTWRRLRGLIGL